MLVYIPVIYIIESFIISSYANVTLFRKEMCLSIILLLEYQHLEKFLSFKCLIYNL